MTFQELILKVADSYVGMEEVGNNEAFKDKVFEKEMIKFGEWWRGAPWCACAVQLIVLKAGLMYISQGIKRGVSMEHPLLKTLDRIMTPSVMQTFWNFKKAKGFTVTYKPKPGSIMFMQSFRNGEGLTTGHTGIVKKVNQLNHDIYEGNTNVRGEREGKFFMVKNRPIDFDTPLNGKAIIGYVNPTQYYETH